MKVLLRHRVLPDAALRGSLVGTSPPVRAAAVRHGPHPSGIELWQAMKGKPRPCLHYTLTVPVDVAVAEPIAVPVTELNIRDAAGGGG